MTMTFLSFSIVHMYKRVLESFDHRVQSRSIFYRLNDFGTRALMCVCVCSTIRSSSSEIIIVYRRRLFWLDGPCVCVCVCGCECHQNSFFLSIREKKLLNFCFQELNSHKQMFWMNEFAIQHLHRHKYHRIFFCFVFFDWYKWW